MLDLFHIPSNTDSTKIFYATGATGWQTWEKPRNAKLIQIFCLSGGGGGGGGAGNTSANSVGGAGGGGGAAFSKGVFPAFLLPDNLYVQVGVGGAGGAGSTGATGGVAGTVGGISYISLAPTPISSSVIIQSATTTGAGGGGLGNTGGAGAGGAAGTVWIPTTSLNAFASIGLILASAGVIGTAGGINTAPPAGPIALASNIVTGGSGGGGKATSITQFNGATLAAASVILTSFVSGGLAPGGAGNNGYGSLNPFCSVGGAGGAGSLTTKGGKGGDGWYGSGGGGGGGGLSGSFGGAGGDGGKGGDGLVIITTIY